MNKYKKVLIVVNDFGVGGAQRMVIDQIHELKSRGVNVKVLTLKNELSQTLSGDLNIEKEDWIHVDYGSLYNLFSFIKVVYEIKKFSPEIVLCNLWMANTIARLACAVLNIKKVIVFELNVYDSVKSKKIFLIDKLLQNLCYKIIACSEAVNESLIKHGIRQEKIEIILNAFDLKKFNLESDISLKNSLGLKIDDFIFTFVGRWVHQKGVDTLLSAFAKFLNENKVDNVKLLLLGRGDMENKMREICKANNIEDKVLFLGIRNDTHKILSFSDVFLLPSRHEGLPIALLEAFAAKVPSIITDFAGYTNIVTDKVEALVAKVDDVNDLASKMSQLKTDEVLRKELISNAYKKVQEYSVQSYIDKVFNL